MGKDFIRRTVEHDEFSTPYSMTRQLLELEEFPRSWEILEPAAGKRAISSVLSPLFPSFQEYDIQHGIDFYNETRKVDAIITNPPYGKEADKFVLKAKTICRKKFAFLLRTNYLSGQARYEAKIYKGLRRVYVFTRMADLRGELRDDGKYPTAGIVYAWMVWEIGYGGAPEIHWIDNQEFVLRKGE